MIEQVSHSSSLCALCLCFLSTPGGLWADIDDGKGVLAALQKDNKAIVRKGANTAKQFTNTLGEQIGSTLEERVISAGLNSISAQFLNSI